MSPFIQRILYSTIYIPRVIRGHKGFCVKLFTEVNCHWHICRGFKQDCPTGELYKEKIVEMYSLILPSGNAQVLLMISDVQCFLRTRFSSIRSFEYLTRTAMEALTLRCSLYKTFWENPDQQTIEGVHASHRHDSIRVSGGEA